MFTVCSDRIYVLTRGSMVKILFKKSELSAWISFLWFLKVRERMDRRSRREGSTTHSSRNSSVSSFSSLLRSSQTLEESGTREVHLAPPWRPPERATPSGPPSREWSHPLPWTGHSLPWVCNICLSDLVLELRKSVSLLFSHFLQEVLQAFLSSTCLLLSPHADLGNYFLLGNCVFQVSFWTLYIYSTSHTSRTILFLWNLLSFNSFLAVKLPREQNREPERTRFGYRFYSLFTSSVTLGVT